MDFDAFAALTKAEQQLYRSWLMRDMAAFAAEYVGAEDRTDANNTLPSGKPSESDDGQKATRWNAYVERMALSNAGLDAQKALVASFYDPTGRDAEKYNTLLEAINALAKIDDTKGDAAWMQGASDVLPVPKIANASAPAKDELGTTYIDTKGINPVGGAPTTGRLFFVRYTDPITNEPTGAWLE